MGLCFAVDGQEEAGRVIGLEGGWNDQVFTRLQHDELHHATWILEGFRLGDRCVSAEEGGWELPAVILELQQKRNISLQFRLFLWAVQCLWQMIMWERTGLKPSYLFCHLEKISRRWDQCRDKKRIRWISLYQCFILKDVLRHDYSPGLVSIKGLLFRFTATLFRHLRWSHENLFSRSDSGQMLKTWYLILSFSKILY